MAFPGTGKIWMNGTLVDWADAKIHIALARHPLRQRRLRGRALLQHAERLGLLPARRAHAAAVRLRQDLPDGAAARSAGADRGRPRDDPRQRVQGLLHPADRLSRLRRARRQPVPVPGRRRDPDLGMGRLSRRRRARAGRRRAGQLVVAHGAEHVPGAGQERRRTTPTRS